MQDILKSNLSIKNKWIFRKVIRDDDPFLKQELLWSIKLGYLEKYVDEIWYNFEQEESERWGLKDMETIPIDEKSFLQGKPRQKSKIIVYPSIFSGDYHKNLADFLGTLICHECFHAEHIFNLNPQILKPLLKDRLSMEIHKLHQEIQAYENEIKHFNKKNSEEYKTSVWYNKMLCLNELNYFLELKNNQDYIYKNNKKHEQK